MQSRDSTSEYLDKVVDGYRGAVQTFARDASILAGLVALITAFVFFPYLRSAEEEQRLKAEIGQVRVKRDRTSAMANELTNLQTGFATAREAIGQGGRDAASQLSQRLSDFAECVRLVSDPQSRASLPSALRSSPVQQFAEPSAGQIRGDPRTILHQDYGLSDEDIADLAPGSGTTSSATATNPTVNLAMAVFHREIDRSYERLNEQIRRRIEQLNQTNQSRLAVLRKPLTELNVTLPQEQQLEVKFNPIPRPQDDRLFHTRAGKGRTLESGVAGVVTDIDAATRPLQQASMALVASEQTLNQSLEELNQNEQRVEELIKSLQDGMGEVEKELTQISVPFSWMPMNVQTFVMAFPAFCSLAFFILAIRFARLSKLRLRLIREMSQADMKDKDIELALCVPNIMLDFLSPVTLESPWRSRVVGALVPLLILVFLGFILLRIQLSPVFKLHSPFLVPLEALGILTAILAWKSFRRYQRFRSSDSKSE